MRGWIIFVTVAVTFVSAVIAFHEPGLRVNCADEMRAKMFDVPAMCPYQPRR